MSPRSIRQPVGELPRFSTSISISISSSSSSISVVICPVVVVVVIVNFNNSAADLYRGELITFFSISYPAIFLFGLNYLRVQSIANLKSNEPDTKTQIDR